MTALPTANLPTADRPREWVRPGWPILVTLTLMAGIIAGFLFVETSPPQSGPGVRWLESTRTAHTSAPTPTPVTLPDSWKSQGLSPIGAAQYTLTFELSAAATSDGAHTPWALRFDRLCAAHRIHLNDQLLHSTLLNRTWLGEPTAHLLDVPPSMLRPGVNTLNLDVRCVLHGGLTAPALAPKSELYDDFLRHTTLTRAVPVILNLCSTVFALFVILLWWHRRQESAAALFGALYLVVSIRNCTYYITADFAMPALVASWGYLVAHLATTNLLGWYALSISQRRIPWFERLLWTTTWSVPIVALLASPWDLNLDTTRMLLQPAMQLMAVPAIWILFQHSRQQQTRSMLVLSLGFASVLITAIHDVVFIRLLGDVEHGYWMPWAVPLTLPGFTMLLMNRVVQAFNDIEKINVTLEAKVRERTHDLAVATAVKGQFLAAASHDLRQPVAAIGLITDLLHERLTDPALKGLTERLTRAVVSMESLLKGLLDLSRLDSGMVEVKMQAVPLQALMEAIASHECESAQHKGLTLRVRATQALAWSDPILLEQILRNLVGNAVRHTEVGGILVGVRPRGAHWRIEVWDTGTGIHPADQDKIFDEFVQLHNPARERRRGLGLGLAIVKRAAHLLGHPIAVASRPGRGSMFCVTVPRYSAPTQHIEAIRPEDTTAPRRTNTPTRVLVVEDDAEVRDALANLLRAWGMDVWAGPGLRWLQQQAHSAPWDLIISDHRLADGTGRDAIDYVRQFQPRLPAIIVTGDTSSEQLQTLADSGLPVLHKPFRAEKLRAMIDSTMTRT